MFKLYKFFGNVSRTSVAVLLFIFVPFSLILTFGSLYLIFFEMFNSLFMPAGAWQDVSDKLKAITHMPNIIEIFRYVGIGILSFTVFLYLMAFISLIIRKTLYKSINGIDVARNKEIRNIDINKTIDKLERYRYRE